MEYERTELTEWYDRQGRVRKRRIRQDRFVLSPWELNTMCNSLVKISDSASKAIVASNVGSRYLPK
ncbi:MAG: hypothetical protein ACLQPD_25570 [Desulfomonilaceae bacterium]